MPWSEQARAELLERIRIVGERKFAAGGDKATYQRLKAELSDTYGEYGRGLPIEDLSRCPVCGAELKLAIDPYGLDGPWWWSLCPIDLPSPEGCRHFQLLQGALDLRGRVPSEAGDNVRPGPGVPFVIGRVLSMEGMNAVISSRQLPVGDTVYLIAYFSSNPNPYPKLYQPWRNETMAVHNAQGQVIGWSIADDPWDFDLAKWFTAGKLWWIAPSDPTLALKKGSPSPYENLPGVRDMQMIENGNNLLVAAPSGRGASPFE